MLLYWSGYILIAQIFMRVTWNNLGLIWIIIACFVFSIGNLVGESFNKKKLLNLSRDTTTTISEKSWNLIIIFICIGVTRTIIEVGLNGFSLSLFLDINTLLDVNSEMAFRRYNGGSVNNILLQIISVFIYAAPLCSGYNTNFKTTKKHAMITYLSFLPITLSVLFTNGKVGLIACVFLWVSGYWVGYIEKNGHAPKVNFRKFIKLIIPYIFVLGILYFSMLLRIGEISMRTIGIVNDKFIVYAFGHIPAFDYWYAYYRPTGDYTFGQYTFMSIFNSLGIATREQGVYELIIGTSSNVFTAFRGLIHDFGIYGSMIVLLLYGLTSGIAYKNVTLRKNSSVSSTYLASVYFFIFYSFIISPWTYTSYILIFPLFYFFLIYSKRNSYVK